MFVPAQVAAVASSPRIGNLEHELQSAPPAFVQRDSWQASDEPCSREPTQGLPWQTLERFACVLLRDHRISQHRAKLGDGRMLQNPSEDWQLHGLFADAAGDDAIGRDKALGHDSSSLGPWDRTSASSSSRIVIADPGSTSR